MYISINYFWQGIAIFLTSLLIPNLCAQQATGLFYENYSGIHGVVKNPAFGQHGSLGWDVNIASANLYGLTNYVGVTNSNLFNFLDAMDSLSILGINEQHVDPTARGILFDGQNRDKSAFAHIDVMGPSVWLDLHSVGLGLFVRGRVEAGVPKINAALGYYQYQELTLGDVQSVTNLQSAGAAWTEYGINISSSAFWYEDISLGINIKYLQGHEGYYLSSPSNFDFTRTVDNQFEINSSASNLAYTAGFSDFESLSRTNRGKGWAIDLGYSQAFERSRVGVSILDLGGISFNNSGAFHRLVINETIGIDVNDITNAKSVEGLINLIDQLTIDSTLVSNSFSVRTPARLVVNYDYQLDQKVFVNSFLSHRITTTENAIRSENNLAISPRYESPWFTIALPIVVNNYESVHVGFAAKFGFLTIGSDNVMSVFGSQNFNGSSIYAAIKVNPFNYGKKGGRGVNCPKVKRSPWDSAKPIDGSQRMRSP